MENGGRIGNSRAFWVERNTLTCDRLGLCLIITCRDVGGGRDGMTGRPGEGGGGVAVLCVRAWTVLAVTIGWVSKVIDYFCHFLAVPGAQMRRIRLLCVSCMCVL